MDNVIAKYGSLGTYVHHIAVCGLTTKDHDDNFKELFSAAKLKNLTFNDSTCIFACTEIDLKGNRICENTI